MEYVPEAIREICDSQTIHDLPFSVGQVAKNDLDYMCPACSRELTEWCVLPETMHKGGSSCHYYYIQCPSCEGYIVAKYVINDEHHLALVRNNPCKSYYIDGSLINEP